MDKEFYRNKQIIEERQRRKEEKLSEKSYICLNESIRKSIITTFVAAVAALEEKVGEQLTPELFEELREEIMNKGNNEVRRMRNELKSYNVVYRTRRSR